MTVETDFSDNAIADFLNAAGWADASLKPIAGDASTRRYMRVLDADRPAILMIAPPGAETADCPPQAGLKERRALGYNALARLAGPNLHAFVAISSALRDAGLSAP
ncbi:MAG: aminoglycoside phosphotransferase family protein, partial [Hyphococcus sp.]